MEQIGEYMENMIQEAQKFVCGDADQDKDKESKAMYADARAELRTKITELFEKKGSFVACLAAAEQQAVKTRKAVRRMEQELCAIFRMDNVANLAEHMATKGAKEAGAMEEALEMSVKIESYKGSSKATTNRAVELMDHIVKIHAEDGGCKQCDGENQIRG